ncbi:hypothetical protein ACC754_40465, partial [Rhizobium johnstonii]
ARCGVCGSRLSFEVTEVLDMDMQSEVLKCIADLRALGVEQGYQRHWQKSRGNAVVSVKR